MIYSNDNTDKKQRKQHYILGVYILPVIVTLLSCLIIYLITNFFHLDNKDKALGYLVSVAFGLTLWLKGKNKWLPLPDRTHYHINTNQNIANALDKGPGTASEPLHYDAIFTYSKTQQVIVSICGAVIIAYGFYNLRNTSIIFPLTIISIGFFLAIQGFRRVIDSTPKLKLSKRGLWTQKLGFRTWPSIKKTKIVRERGYRSTQSYLEIYLLDGNFTGIDFPDERLSLDGIGSVNKIELLINEFRS